MKRILAFLSSFLILITGSKPAYAIQQGQKEKTELDTELREFWHDTYLGLEEDTSGAFDIYKRANREIFEQIKKSIKKQPFFEHGFASDSASTRGFIIISMSRFPNGRLRAITAKYVHKNPRYELTRTLFRERLYDPFSFPIKGRSKGWRINERYAGITISHKLYDFLIEIHYELRAKITRRIMDSTLAILNGKVAMLPQGLGRITGQVLDSINNNPISGAGVELIFQYEMLSELGATTKTDEKGYFEILNVPTGDWTVVISYNCSRPNYNITVEENQTVSIGTIKVRNMSTGNGRITGQVLDSTTNEPLKGATVRLYCTGGISPELGAVTDEKGNFEVTNVPFGTWQIVFGYDPKHLSNHLNNINIEESRTVSIGIVKLVRRRTGIVD